MITPLWTPLVFLLFQSTTAQAGRFQREVHNDLDQTASVWFTRGDPESFSDRLSLQDLVQWRLEAAEEAHPDDIQSIRMEASHVYQEMDGVGFALTQASAEALLSLEDRSTLLQELFTSDGIGISKLRVSIGPSDLSTSLYTYVDDDDWNLDSFSLEGRPDLETTLFLLQEILQVAPHLRLLATPWSAPPWMKDNRSWIGGHLRRDCYDVYANYLVRYIQEIQTVLGTNVWAMTPQNEPLNDANEPSMVMTAEEELEFLNDFLGPALQAHGLSSTRLLAFDHNCDHPEYPTWVANSSPYVSGSAFHLYAGDISVLSQVHEATGKDVFFTEQWTSIHGNFDEDLGWHLQHVVTGAARNWAKSILEWNLVTTPNALGCPECQGALSLDGQEVHRHVSYYVIGHIGKFLQPGAVRVGSSPNNVGIYNVAFVNPNGERVLIVYNSWRDRPALIRVEEDSRPGAFFDVEVPQRSAATLVWQPVDADVYSSGGKTHPQRR